MKNALRVDIQKCAKEGFSRASSAFSVPEEVAAVPHPWTDILTRGSFDFLRLLNLSANGIQ